MSELLSVSYKLSKGLELTEFRKSDVASIVRHINDEEIAKNTLQIPYPYYEKDGYEFVEMCRSFEDKFGHVSQYALRWKGEMIGGIGFLYVYGETSHIAEIGYWIGAEFRSRGFITQAIRKIVEIGWAEKGLFRIEANVFVGNLISMKALENAGFVKEGVRKARFIKDDELMDAVMYAKIRE